MKKQFWDSVFLTMFKCSLKRTMPCRAELWQGGSLCEHSSTLEADQKWTTMVPFWYALHPTRVWHTAYQWGTVWVFIELNCDRVDRFASIQALLWKANQSGPPWYALHPTWAQHIAYQWGAVQAYIEALIVARCDSFLACSEPHQEVVHRGTIPDQFSTGTVRFRSIKCPSDAAQVRHTLRECLNTLRSITSWSIYIYMLCVFNQ